MSLNSKIEWTESTWNPITGCTKISDGCTNCYAERLAKRLKAMRNPRYKNGFKITIHKDLFQLPLKWKKPQLIFVNSMSDLFHEDISDEYIFEIFDTMNKAHWHTFQVLTKRSDRLSSIAKQLTWTPNIWQGVTVESSKFINRIDHLRDIPSNIKFVSFEPLINKIGEINFGNIDWAIVGGESGIGARPMDEKWVLDIKKQCDFYNVHFYFKQWGGINKKKTGRTLLGQTWDAFPGVI